MNRELIKESIRGSVQDAIKESVNGETIQSEEQLDEGFGLAFASIAALGGAWAMLRQKIRKTRKNEIYQQFFSKYNVSDIEKNLQKTVKKMRLVNSLSDFDRLEDSAEKQIKEVEHLQGYVDKFVDNVYRNEPNWVDKAFMTDPQTTKMELKQYIKDIVRVMRQGFEDEIEAGKDKLLDG